MAPKKMVQRPLSFQKEKKNEEQNTRTRNDEVDTTGVEVITIDDSSTTSDDPKRTDDSASSPLGGQNVDSVKTPFATMGHRKEEEDAKKKPVEEEKKGGEKRKKGGVVPKTKTSAEEMVMSSPDSAEKKRAERGKKAKGDDDDSDFEMTEKKLGVAGSKSGVSKTPARRAALAVEPKKTKKAPAKKVMNTSTKAPTKGDLWTGPETKALIAIREEVLIECVVDSNFLNENIPSRVQKKAMNEPALRARTSNQRGMQDRLKTLRNTIIIPYVLGEIDKKKMKDKLEFESDEDVETFVVQFQLEFALDVFQNKTIDDAEKEDYLVSARKYGPFGQKGNRREDAIAFLLDRKAILDSTRKAELTTTNEGKKEESDILWYEEIPAKKGKDKRDRFFKDIIGRTYEGAVKFTPKFHQMNENFNKWSSKCLSLAELECKREGMVKVFREAKKAQARYTKKEVNEKDEEGKEIEETIETLDEARRVKKEECIRFVWKFYEAASYDFEKAKHNLDVAWEMEKGDPKFDANKIPKEALNKVRLYQEIMVNVCKDEEGEKGEELKNQVFELIVKLFNRTVDVFEYETRKEMNAIVEENETYENIINRDDVKAGLARLRERKLTMSRRGTSRKE